MACKQININRLTIPYPLPSVIVSCQRIPIRVPIVSVQATVMSTCLPGGGTPTKCPASSLIVLNQKNGFGERAAIKSVCKVISNARKT